MAYKICMLGQSRPRFLHLLMRIRWPRKSGRSWWSRSSAAIGISERRPHLCFASEEMLSLSAIAPDTHTNTHTHTAAYISASQAAMRGSPGSVRHSPGRIHAKAEGAEGAVVPDHWIWRDGMRLTSKAQLLEGGVVPERLRKRPGPLVPDVVACEGPRHTHKHTHAHTHGRISASQTAVGGSPGSVRQSPGRIHAKAEGAEGAVVPHHWIWRGGMRLTFKVQLLKCRVVPERLRKRPGPFVPDAVFCEGPRHTHTQTAASVQVRRP